MTSTSPTTQRADPAAHVPALDGLRGIAVLLVIAYHLALFLPGGLVRDTLRLGAVGVDLFFVLSGFLITGILWDSLGGKGYFRTFYARRTIRIFPLYYAFLAVYTLLLFAFAVDTTGWVDALPWFLLYGTNILLGVAGTTEVTPYATVHLWSLAVEEQFYLLWPAVIYAVRSRRTLMRVCAALIGFALAVRIGLVVTGHELAAYVILPARLDALALGGMLALWLRGPATVDELRRRALRWLPVAAVPLAAVCVLAAGAEPLEHPLQRTVGHTLWAAVFGGVLLVARGSGGGVLTRGWLRYTGRISYCLYIVHYPVIHMLAASGLRDPLLLVPAALAASYAISAASWRYLEAPSLRLKDRFQYGSGASAGPAVVVARGAVRA